MSTFKRRRTGIVLGVCIAALVVLVIAGIFLIRRQLNETAYTRTIETAEKYIEDGDYESAVAAYETAIDLCPYESEAYVDLAELYLDQGELSLAKVTLRRGKYNVDSARIDYLLDGIISGSITVVTGGETDTEKITLASAGSLAIDTAFVQRLEDYTYADYEEAYGADPQIAQVSDDVVEVVHEELSATFTYENTDQFTDVVDDGEPEDDSQPQTVSLDDLSVLFTGFTGTASLSQLQKLSSRTAEPVTDEEQERTTVTLTVSTLEICIETDESGNLLSAAAWNEITMTQANESRSGLSYAGVIIDATTGEGISGALVTFVGRTTGLSVSDTTSSTGSFSVDLEPDTYDVTVTKDGYIDETQEITVVSGKTYSGEQFTISPSLAAGTMRIVLEWNAQPQDLDSYLLGETDDGEDVYVSFRSTQCVVDGEVVAELDVDDTNGYGPETITIYDLNGTYDYVVMDYRMTGTLQQYGATVKVYREDSSEPEVIELSASAGVDNLWDVISIEDGEVTILNTSGDYRSTSSMSK